MRDLMIKQQLEALNDEIAGAPANDDAYFRRGLLYWKAGRYGEAISDYERAVALNPSSPAAEALEMSRDVMNFFNRDLYNP